MRKLSIPLMLMISTVASFAQKPTSIEGIWEGAVLVGAIKLRLAFHIAKVDSGYTGTLDSIDQGAKAIPLSSAKMAGSDVTFECKSIQATFTGKLDASGESIVGTLKQGAADLPLTLKRVMAATKLNRPQEPKPPFPYDSEDISYPNEHDKIKLGGTLTVPKGGGPFPAVIMATGSGIQDRDESILGHKPFWVIADALSRMGIAVLRVDDRGFGSSTGDPSKATTADFATDTAAGIAYLKSRKDIDPKRIGVLGHSEGGEIAAMLGANNPDVAFIIMMAGPGVNGEELILLQASKIAEAMGYPESADQAAFRKKLFGILKSEPDLEKAKVQLNAVFKDMFDKLTPAEQKEAGSPEKLAATTLPQLANPWMRFFLSYDPRTDLRKIKIPVLAIYGSKDLQVIASQNLPEIKKALQAAGNANFTVTELRGLNHLFQKSETGLPSEYVEIEETINSTALDAIRDWLKRIVLKNT